MTTEIDYRGVSLSVEYGLDGKYYPATLYEPEEHPEVIIKTICASDSFVDLQEMLSWEQIDEILNLIEI